MRWGLFLTDSWVRVEVWAQYLSPLHKPITQKPSDGLIKTVLLRWMDSRATPMYQSLLSPTSTVQLCLPELNPLAASTAIRWVWRSGLSGRTSLEQYSTQVSSSEKLRLDCAVLGSKVIGSVKMNGFISVYGYFSCFCSMGRTFCKRCELTTLHNIFHFSPSLKLEGSDMSSYIYQNISQALWIPQGVFAPKKWWKESSKIRLINYIV